jgi:hypothetical protein
MKRYWDDANYKRNEGCRLYRERNCDGPIELAHTIPRIRDEDREMMGETVLPKGFVDICSKVFRNKLFYITVRYVDPDGVIPLCKFHHHAYDLNLIGILEVMTVAEQAYAVQAAGGIELARNRLIGAE